MEAMKPPNKLVSFQNQVHARHSRLKSLKNILPLNREKKMIKTKSVNQNKFIM
jgi:hypothetical protein